MSIFTTTSRTDHAKRKQELDRSLREAQEGVEVGKETLNELALQGESLKHSEGVLDSTKYTLEPGKRTLRRMSWMGSFQLPEYADRPPALCV